MVIAERYKVLEDENVLHEGTRLLQRPRTCETCRNSVIPDMMAIFTYRDHAIVLQALVPSEASIIRALFKILLRQIQNRESVKARTQYVE